MINSHCRLFNTIYILLLILFQTIYTSNAVWTRFDLVRDKVDGWGSNGRTPYIEISGDKGNAPKMNESAEFGSAVTRLGDIDGDGIEDIAIGARGEMNFIHDYTYYQLKDDKAYGAGAVYIFFMNDDGSVKSHTHICGDINGGPTLFGSEHFGHSLAPMGDLNGDDIPDLAVGAPGEEIASVYILYLNRDGSVGNHTLIRGHVTGTVPYNQTAVIRKFNTTFTRPWIPNGPEIVYNCQFGSSLAAIGDFNKDGVPDLAAGYFDISSGKSIVFFLYLTKNGTVLYYDQITPGVKGAPTFTYSHPMFGSSITLLPDLDNDGINEIAFGAKFNDDKLTTHVRSGSVYVLYLNADASIKKYSKISELPLEDSQKGAPELPSVENDNCGTALTTIGDLNKDYARQHKPWLNYTIGDDHYGRVSMPDLIVGCPQPDMTGFTGRAFIYFLSQTGGLADYKEMLGPTDSGLKPELKEMDRFGTSISSYKDIDNNGIGELLIGAPGTFSNGKKIAGKVYIIFLRRRRWHPYIPCTPCYIASFAVPAGLCCFSCMIGTCFFFWYFRRKPDEIELIVVKSGVEITKERKRKKKKFGKESGKVYADDYDV